MKKKQAILNFYLASKGKQDRSICYEQIVSSINVDYIIPLLVDGTEQNVLLTIDKDSIWDDYAWDIVRLIERSISDYEIELVHFPTAYWTWQRKMISMIIRW